MGRKNRTGDKLTRRDFIGWAISVATLGVAAIFMWLEHSRETRRDERAERQSVFTDAPKLTESLSATVTRKGQPAETIRLK